MNKKRTTPRRASTRRFPRRILIADIAYPTRGESEVAIVTDDVDWSDLPTAIYVRADEARVRGAGR
jgi:hypothetical protein